MADLVLSDSEAPLLGAELRQLARLTADEDEREVLPLQYGPVEGVAVLRRRVHGPIMGALEVLDLPAVALVVALPDGSASWAARGLESLDDSQLLAFSRRVLEVVGAVSREQVRREVRHV